ncbi:MAG: hypothetical protein EBX28_12020 [Betaproteobacteria bacterium]|nr:hypothetical protein [Betaproteobacteria bacterium]NDH30707.1 hypothetical protein [Betaproteobacteria bacterium]
MIVYLVVANSLFNLLFSPFAQSLCSVFLPHPKYIAQTVLRLTELTGRVVMFGIDQGKEGF